MQLLKFVYTHFVHPDFNCNNGSCMNNVWMKCVWLIITFGHGYLTTTKSLMAGQIVQCLNIVTAHAGCLRHMQYSKGSVVVTNEMLL